MDLVRVSITRRSTVRVNAASMAAKDTPKAASATPLPVYLRAH